MGEYLLSPAKLECVEEVADLERGGLGGIRAVDGVLLDARGEVLPYGPLCRLGGVGGAHYLPVFGDRVLPFEHHQDYRAPGHETGQAPVKGPLFMDYVKALGVFFGELHHFEGRYPEPVLLEPAYDFPDYVLFDAVRLYDR